MGVLTPVAVNDATDRMIGAVAIRVLGLWQPVRLPCIARARHGTGVPRGRSGARPGYAWAPLA